jgi:hypothetical protein
LVELKLVGVDVGRGAESDIKWVSMSEFVLLFVVLEWKVNCDFTVVLF